MSHPKPKTNSNVSTQMANSASRLRVANTARPSQPASIDQENVRDLLLPIKDSGELKVRLRSIKRVYKRGRFGTGLKNAARNLFDYYKTAEMEDTKEYWRGRTLLYELNDIFNIDPTICETTFVDGNQVREALRTQAVKHHRIGFVCSEKKVLLEKVLFCACYAHELQRRGEKQHAFQIFDWLLRFIKNSIADNEDLPCYEIQATLCYHLGSVLRKLEQHSQAELMFSESLDLLYKRGKRRKDDVDDCFFAVRKQAMIIGLGFGLTNLAKGSLQRAEHALKASRALLARSDDPVIPAYVELHCGVIERCRAGSNRKKLSEAIKKLEQARDALKSHDRYQVRACWELALAKTLLSDFEGARVDLQQVSIYAEQKLDQKWASNVHILQSRMLRLEHKAGEALMEAELAVQRSEGSTSLPLIDALITRGEAQLAVAEEAGSTAVCAMARADFERALRSVLEQESFVHGSERLSNPKIAAVCELRIAQTYARQGDQATALSHFSEWLFLENQVEHAWVRELASNVKAEIDTLSESFTISATDEIEWGYTENVARLRRWLLRRALRHTKQNYSEAARLLGIQRATLYQWLVQEDPDSKRRTRPQS